MRAQTYLQAMNAPLSMQSMPLSEGDQGTEETIRQIRVVIDQGVKDPAINRAAIAIVRGAGVRQFDFDGEKRAIYQWVLQNIRFIKDMAGKETVRSAAETLTVRAGDCDCITTLMASLLGTIGHRVRLVTISAHPVSPNFSHIYAEVQLQNGQWVPVDAARREASFGKGPGRYSRKRIWYLNSDDYVDVQGTQRWMGRCELGYYGLGGTQKRVRYPRLLGDPFDTTDTSTLPNAGGPIAAPSGFDWTDLSKLITAGTTGAANIIRANSGLPAISPTGLPVSTTVNLPGNVSLTTSTTIAQAVATMRAQGYTGPQIAQVLQAQGFSQAQIQQYVPDAGFSSFFNSLPSWAIPVGLGIAAIALLRR